MAGFRGTFAVDESAGGQTGASVSWTVSYGGAVVCRVTASWGSPGTCDAQTSVPASGTELVIDQVVTSATPGRALWAGVHQPRLTVLVDPERLRAGTDEPRPRFHRPSRGPSARG